MTARWVVDEVRPHRDLHITWQPISLFFKNEPTDDSDSYAPAERTHSMLRVLEAVRADHGDDAIEPIYWEFGRRIHHDQDREFEIADALDAVGVDRGFADAAADDKWDTEIRTRMDAGLELTGQDVGTPIIALTDRHGDKQGYFGPVITSVPPTEDSLAMWDALSAMMSVKGFWELKRTRTERPDFGARP